jgi:exopolysaccharide biosynthesis polyprenyl glycosylphosphotransferase
LPVLEYDTRDPSRSTMMIKRVFDLFVSASTLIVLLPLFPLVALAIKLDSRGPVFFTQRRAGRGGVPFRMYKLRTMVADAERALPDVVALEDLPEPMFKLRADPRVTRMGRLLRRFSLDELPQLINVLRGDMSIVGPRPERPEFVELLAEHVPFWTRRHLVKPGITGWAQVRHRYTSDVPGTTEKLSYDLYYLKHRSLFLDLAIVAKTAKTVFSGSGAV